VCCQEVEWAGDFNTASGVAARVGNRSGRLVKTALLEQVCIMLIFDFFRL